jgi:sialate O-acetylesterase
MLKICAIMLVLIQAASARTGHQEVNLRGSWRFQIGDDASYASPELNDSDWDRMRVPGNWEQRGYRDYDGYAWYRTRFKIGKNLEEKSLFLNLGRIDDVDRVYLNGKLIGGRGQFFPEYRSAYNVPRRYAIPKSLLRFGEENVLAVQVYDDEQDGGIVSGRIGIESESSQKAALDLTGDWKFSEGDDSSWSEAGINDSDWDTVTVPMTWESQGYPDLDGFAWYRVHVTIPRSMSADKLMLVLGAVDDVDQVFLNGKRIGQTGMFPPERHGKSNQKYYDRERRYNLPADQIKWDGDNVLAVRVYDADGEGGIFQGPVGIYPQKGYLKNWRSYHSDSRDDDWEWE